MYVVNTTLRNPLAPNAPFIEPHESSATALQPPKPSSSHKISQQMCQHNAAGVPCVQHTNSVKCPNLCVRVRMFWPRVPPSLYIYPNRPNSPSSEMSHKCELIRTKRTGKLLFYCGRVRHVCCGIVGRVNGYNVCLPTYTHPNTAHITYSYCMYVYAFCGCRSKGVNSEFVCPYVFVFVVVMVRIIKVIFMTRHCLALAITPARCDM